MSKALITGGAGFIGSHLARDLLESSWDVTVLDNFDPFYSKATKLANILAERKSPRFHLIEADIRDYASLREQAAGPYDVIVHLAAKAVCAPQFCNPTNILKPT